MSFYEDLSITNEDSLSSLSLYSSFSETFFLLYFSSSLRLNDALICVLWLLLLLV